MKFSSFRRPDRWHLDTRTWRTIGAALLPVVAVFVIVAVRLNAIRTFASSDALIAASAAGDLLAGRLRGWIFAPAPFFFPDMVISAGLRVVRPGVDLAYVGYPFLSALLLYSCARRLAGVLAPGLSRTAQRWSAVAGIALIAAPSFGVGANTPVPMINMVLGPSWHGGATLVVLVLLLMTERVVRLDRTSVATLVAFGFLVFAGVMSDHLLLPQALLPISVVVAQAWRAGVRRSVVCRWSFVATAATLLALVAERSLPSFGYGIGTAGRPFVNVFGVIEVIHLLPELAIDYPTWTLATVVICVQWWRDRRDRTPIPVRERPIVALLGLSVVAATLSTAFLAFEDIGQFRRMQPVFVVPLLMFPTLIARSQRARARLLAAVDRVRSTGFTPAIGGAVVLAIAPFALMASRDSTSISMPPGLRCLDRLHTEGQLGTGLSDYWTARLYAEKSTSSLGFVALWAPGSLQATTVNLRPLIESGQRGKVDLVRDVNFIVPTGLNPGRLRTVYGAPDEVINCDGLEVWRYNDGRLASGVRSLIGEARRKLQA